VHQACCGHDLVGRIREISAALCRMAVPPLKGIRIGRRVLFFRESLEEWLRQVEAQGTVGKT